VGEIGRLGRVFKRGGVWWDQVLPSAPMSRSRGGAAGEGNPPARETDESAIRLLAAADHGVGPPVGTARRWTTSASRVRRPGAGWSWTNYDLNETQEPEPRRDCPEAPAPRASRAHARRCSFMRRIASERNGQPSGARKGANAAGQILYELANRWRRALSHWRAKSGKASGSASFPHDHGQERAEGLSSKRRLRAGGGSSLP
jgi:hypothetical protein